MKNLVSSSFIDVFILTLNIILLTNLFFINQLSIYHIFFDAKVATEDYVSFLFANISLMFCSAIDIATLKGSLRSREWDYRFKIRMSALG